MQLKGLKRKISGFDLQLMENMIRWINVPTSSFQTDIVRRNLYSVAHSSDYNTPHLGFSLGYILAALSLLIPRVTSDKDPLFDQFYSGSSELSLSGQPLSLSY